MAGHSHSANIAVRKGKQDAVQERLFQRVQDAAVELGMDALVEVHDESEMERALELKSRLIGINNRDLRTFQTDIETTLRLLPSIPSEVVVVSESGINTAADVTRLREKGVHAFLIGEALMRAPDPGVKLREFLHGPCEDLRHHEC